MEKFLKIVIIFTLLIFGVSIYFIVNNNVSYDKPVAGKGSTVNKNDINIGGEPFTLTDHNGNIFTEQDLIGNPSMVYFGFTFCPDVCPASLEKFAKIFDTFKRYSMKVKFIFISIDPLRDRPELLKKYLEYFNEDFIGLTGSEEEIKKVADSFKVIYTKSNSLENKDDYMMDHTTLLYILDKNAKYQKHFFLNSTQQEIENYIRSNKNLLF